MRILVLEDDQHLSDAFARRLRDDGHAVDVVHTLGDAEDSLVDFDYDILVFDRMVPGGDALELVEETRSRGNGAAVLVLSAHGGVSDRIEGLERGADDYVPKPVALKELSLRVGKLIRLRSQTHAEPLRIGRVTVDSVRRQASIDGKPVELSRTQFAILEYLALQADRPVPTEELLEHVWDHNVNPLSSAVPPQISRLRNAFEGVLKIRRLREMGYVLETVDPAADAPEPARPENR